MGLTLLLCQPKSSLWSFRHKGKRERLTQPRDLLASTRNLRRALQGFTQTTEQQQGGDRGKKKEGKIKRTREKKKRESEGDAESKGSDSFPQR